MSSRFHADPGDGERIVARVSAALFSDAFAGWVEVCGSDWAAAWRVLDGKEPIPRPKLTWPEGVSRAAAGEERMVSARRAALGEGLEDAGAIVLDFGEDWLLIAGPCRAGSWWGAEQGWTPVADAPELRERWALLRDVDAMALRLREAEELLTFDPESGLLNRAALLGHIEQAIARARRDGKPFSVARLEIAPIQGRAQEAISTDVVRRVARILVETVRREDHVARVARSGFAIVFLGGDGQEAPAALDRISRNLKRSEVLSERGLVVHVGARTFYEPAASAVEALNAAEAMLVLERERAASHERRRV